MKSKNLQIVEKIIGEISLAESFLAGVDFESFISQEMLMRAVCMTVINTGELVKNLDMDFRDMHPNIPWKAIAGFRDIAAHRYQTLRMEDVFTTVKDDFPSLHGELLKICQ